MKALSVRQPWVDAVLYGGKRIENRLAWRSCSYRGPLLLHAAKGMTEAEYHDACDFMHARGIGWRPGHMTIDRMRRGYLVGACEVVDVIQPPVNSQFAADHPLAGDCWYMGGFALVLDNVRAFAVPVPWRGMLGLFEVDTSGMAL